MVTSLIQNRKTVGLLITALLLERVLLYSRGFLLSVLLSDSLDLALLNLFAVGIIFRGSQCTHSADLIPDSTYLLLDLLVLLC